jgi:phosphoribosylformylglycinamidine cyclo-ligase
MPDGLAAHVDLGSIAVPPVFGWLRRVAGLDEAEMLRTFNCGVGMIVIADASRTDAVMTALREAGETPFTIGTVELGRGIMSEAKGKGLAEAVRYSAMLGA